MALNGIPSNSGLSHKKRGKMVDISTTNIPISSSESKPSSKLKRHKTLESTSGKRRFSGSSPRDSSANKSCEQKRKKNKKNSTNSSGAISRPAPRPSPRLTPSLDPRSAPGSNSRTAARTASSNTPGQLRSHIHSINSSASALNSSNSLASTHSQNKRRLDANTPTANSPVIPSPSSSPLPAILTLPEKKKQRKMEAKTAIGKRRFSADSMTATLSPPPSLRPHHIEQFNIKKQKMTDMQKVLGKRSFPGSNDSVSPSIPAPEVFFLRSKKNRWNCSKASYISSIPLASNTSTSSNASTSSNNPSTSSNASTSSNNPSTSSNASTSSNTPSASNNFIESNDDLNDNLNASYPLSSPTPNVNLHTSSSPLASFDGELISQFQNQNRNRNQLQPIPDSDGEDGEEFEVGVGLNFETDSEDGNETEKEKEKKMEEFEFFYDALDEFAREDEAAGEIDSEFMDALDHYYV